MAQVLESAALSPSAIGDRADRDGGFGVYVHWPFCSSKCPYCDFNSHVRHRGVDQPRFARALSRELKSLSERTTDRRPSTVFFGGGTPSLMEPATVGAVLEAIDRSLGLPADAEISLEANPTSVEQSRFEGFAAAGVNRVSLGVQSLRDADLVALGRRHDAATARHALATAKKVFSRVSADLIYARPGQTAAVWMGELTEMLDIAGDHLSLYQLTIEAGTRFYDLAAKGKLVVPEDDLAADLYDLTDDLTRGAGYRRYEVSNHARSGAQAQHNLIYWRGGRYLGVGPGAHGRMASDGVRLATSTIKHPETWRDHVELHGHGIAAEEVLGAEEMAAETLIMGLRLEEGIDLDLYARRAGVPLPAEHIDDLCGQGLLVRRGQRIAIPEAARLLTNGVVRELLP
ncbi:MAG: radical SAM family heme chaperone HemW [Pseudomonadota bacterium]